MDEWGETVKYTVRGETSVLFILDDFSISDPILLLNVDVILFNYL